MNSQINSPVQENGDLNAQALFSSFQRHRKIIVAGSILGSLLSVIYTSVSQPLWKGSFEIVLSGSGKSAPSGGGGTQALISQIAGFGSTGLSPAELKTQVKILESQSVLRKVFEQDMARAHSANKNFGHDFYSWKENLSVDLNRGTSVLDISFISSDKSNILPVLKDVSAAYQTYSMKERMDALRNGILFAEEQLVTYREKADKSNRALNQLGLKYGITSNSRGPSTSDSIDISAFLNKESNSGFGVTSSGGSSVKTQGDPLAKLASINLDLIRLGQKFTKNDPTIVMLTRERDAIKHYLETSASGSISYPGSRVLSKDEAQNILIRYQELERKASLDQNTLESLESTLLSLKLEQARIKKPWDLISSPAILGKPISPRPLRNFGIGLLSGTLIGCLAGLVIDMRSRRIFGKCEFTNLLPVHLALELPRNPDQSWNDGLRILSQKNSHLKNLAITPIGDVEGLLINKVRDLLAADSSFSVEICNSILNAARYQARLFVASPGSSTAPQLTRLAQQISLQKTPSIGLVWIE